MFRFLLLTLLLGAAFSTAYAAPDDDPMEGITPPEKSADEEDIDDVDIADQLDPRGQRMVTTTPGRATTNDPGDEWLGRTANAPAADPPEVAQAKAKAEEIFEKLYRTADSNILGRYAVNPIISRTTITPEGKEKSVVVPQIDVRDFLQRQFADDRKKLPKDISYSMPWYRMEGKNVRVNTVRSESNPHKVFDVSLLVGPQAGDKWVIIEDSWSQANRD